MHAQFRLPILILPLSLAAGCHDVAGPGPSEPPPAGADIVTYFNPQPEPPGRLFRFTAVGQPDGEWGGRFGDAALVSSLSVETHSYEAMGATVRLAQTWTLFPPDPVIPPDPIHPPDPVFPPDPIAPLSITLGGILNLTTGELVLNGRTADGVPVHVRADVQLSSGGLSIPGGELMFNPQPEPPGRS